MHSKYFLFRTFLWLFFIAGLTIFLIIPISHTAIHTDTGIVTKGSGGEIITTPEQTKFRVRTSGIDEPLADKVNNHTNQFRKVEQSYLIQQNQQIIDGLANIPQSLSPLQKLSEKPLQIWGIDYRLIPGFAAGVSLIIALFIPPFAEYLRRRPSKSKLTILGFLSVHQSDAIITRLVIKNESNNAARLAEAYVYSISDDETNRVDFLPVPLPWAHGQFTGSKNRRDIYGQQIVYLDTLEYKQIKSVGSLELQTDVREYAGIEQFYKLNKGVTKLDIKIYQESAQTVSCIIVVKWDGVKNPELFISSQSTNKRHTFFHYLS